MSPSHHDMLLAKLNAVWLYINAIKRCMFTRRVARHGPPSSRPALIRGRPIDFSCPLMRKATYMRVMSVMQETATLTWYPELHDQVSSREKETKESKERIENQSSGCE